MAPEGSQHTYVYADSEDSLPAGLICAVCHDVCGRHSACPGCNQSFCQVCVHKWFMVQRTTGSQCTCPYCRRKLRFSDLTHDPAIQQQLDQLPVLCTNAKAGCPAVVPRADLPAHLQHSCMLETVACKFCSTTGTRSDIQQHEASTCSKRLVPCIHAASGCHAMVPLDATAQHLELNCNFSTKPCPSCRTQVPRHDWSAHLQDRCPTAQPCPLRLYGCSFSGDAHAVSAHSSSCPYLQHKQQLQGQLLSSPAAAAAAARKPDLAFVTPSAAGALAGPWSQAALQAVPQADPDPGELPTGCVPNAAAAFKASSAWSSDCQVRQGLLGTIPQAMLPPRLPAQQQQQRAARSSALKQLSTPTPPMIFRADAAAGSNRGPQAADFQPNSSSSSTDSSGSSIGCVPSAVDMLARGGPSCLSGVGLQHDPLLEAAWRTILNLSVVASFKTQEAAGQQALSAFMVYSSICRAWETVQAFSAMLQATAGKESEQQQQQQPAEAQAEGSEQQQQEQQQQMQQQLQEQQQLLQQHLQQQQQQQQGGSSTNGGVLASFTALLGLNRSAPPTPAQQAAQQAAQLNQQLHQQMLMLQQRPLQLGGRPQGQHQQQQARQQQQGRQQSQLTGRQIWQRWLAEGTQGQPTAPRGSSSSSGDGSSSGNSMRSSDTGAAADDDDGMPGLQRALYDDEYAAIEYWFNKEQQGPQLLAAVCAAVYPLCMWLGVAGPCLVGDPADAEGLSQLTGWAAGLLSTLAIIQAKTAAAQQRRQQRKRQWEQEEEPGAAGARGAGQGPFGGQGRGGSGGNRPTAGPSSIAAAAAAGALPFGIRGLGYGGLPPRHAAANYASSSRDRTSAGASGAAGRQQQQQQHGKPDPEVQLQEEVLLEVLTQAAELQIDPDNPRKAQRMRDATKHLEPIVALLSEKLRARGEPFAAVRQHLMDSAAGSAVAQSKNIPRWLYGLRPLVAAELSSALLLLNDVRAEQCEISLIPGVNANVQHGYRGYWAVSVLAGAQAWLGPGFKLSWQAVAVVNDMVTEVVQELCQVLGDSFYDPAEERVPMSPALVHEAARLVLPKSLLEEGLPHLLRLSVSYLDASCEDLSDVTWEQLARKLGLKAELDKMVCLVNELLPVTFMDTDSDEDETDEETEDDTDSYTDEEEDEESGEDSYVSDSDGDDDDDDSYVTDEGGDSSGDSDGAPVNAAAANSRMTPFQRLENLENDYLASIAYASAVGAQPSRGSDTSGSADASGDWESADEEEAAEILSQQQHQQQRAAALGAGTSDTLPAGAVNSSSLAAQAGTAAPLAASQGGSDAADASDDHSKSAHGGQQAQQQAAAAAGTSASAAAGSSTDWKQEWVAALAGLSDEAAAAAAAAAAGAHDPSSAGGAAPMDLDSTVTAGAAGASTVQQQLSPYTAQLLQEACDVALHQPEQLLLQQQGQQAHSFRLCAGAAVTGIEGIEGTAEQLYLRSAALPATQVVADLSSNRPAAEALPNSSDSTAAAAAAAAAGASTSGARGGSAAAAAADFGPSRMTAPAVVDRGAWGRRQEGDTEGEPGALVTHGVVVLVGLVEVVLQRLLRAAAHVAAADPQLLLVNSRQSSSRSSSSSSGSHAAGANGDVLCPRSEGGVWVTAKHVQLAVAQDEHLAPLLLNGWPGASIQGGVAWAGATFSLDSRLLPDPTTDPITAFLVSLAQGTRQQQQQQESVIHSPSSSPSSSSGSSRHVVLFPADLRVYCGATLSAPPAAVPMDAAQTAQAAAAAASESAPRAPTAAAGQGNVSESEGPSVTCCFMSGWQCSSCAAQSAALAAAGLEAQLAACQSSLQQANQAAVVQQEGDQRQGTGPEGCVDTHPDSGLACRLSEEQLQQLLLGTRMYHLQQPSWWAAGSANSGDLAGNAALQAAAGASSGLFSGQQQAQQGVGVGPKQLDAVDRLQLQQLQPLLQPLRDVVALRETHLQQQQQSSVLPDEYFSQLVHDMVGDVVRTREQEKQERELMVLEMQERLRCGTARSAEALASAVAAAGGGGAAAARAGSGVLCSPSRGANLRPSGTAAVSPAAASSSSGAGAGGASSAGEAVPEVEMQPDAVLLLQQAAEDFLVQQLAGANRLALHAGRQEVGVEDLRLAMQTSGYVHLQPGFRARRETAGSKRRRVLGAPSLI